MYHTLLSFLTFIENNPYDSIGIFIALICVIVITVKLSRVGLLRRYSIGPVYLVIGQPSLIIKWIGPSGGSHNKDSHEEVFRRSLDAAKYGTTDFNMGAYTQLMELSGYTNIKIEEYRPRFSDLV
jgi:hypothetical protein